jgi:hypothetical protein
LVQSNSVAAKPIKSPPIIELIGVKFSIEYSPVERPKWPHENFLRSLIGHTFFSRSQSLNHALLHGA